MRRIYFALLWCVVVMVFATADTVKAGAPQGYFTDITPVLVDASFSDFDVAVTGDDLTMFFSNAGGRGGEGGEEIWMATRADADQMFENIVNLGAPVNSPAGEQVGSVSPDGRILYFGSSRAGSADMYQATRDSINEPFGNVTSLGPGVNTPDKVENSPSMTTDGKVLVYHSREPDGERDIWLATRDSTSDPFGNAAPLAATINEYSESWPSISADGLTLVWSDWIEFPPRPGGKGSIDIWVSYREDPNEEFVSVVNINDFWPGTNVNGTFADGSPYLSPNWPARGSKLYFISNSLTGELVADIFQATWVPEPSAIVLALMGLLGLRRLRQ